MVVGAEPATTGGGDAAGNDLITCLGKKRSGANKVQIAFQIFLQSKS